MTSEGHSQRGSYVTLKVLLKLCPQGVNTTPDILFHKRLSVQPKHELRNLVYCCSKITHLYQTLPPRNKHYDCKHMLTDS